MKYEGVNFRNFWSICPGMPLTQDNMRLAPRGYACRPTTYHNLFLQTTVFLDMPAFTTCFADMKAHLLDDISSEPLMTCGDL